MRAGARGQESICGGRHGGGDGARDTQVSRFGVGVATTHQPYTRRHRGRVPGWCGLTAPTCYYKAMYRGLSHEDDKGTTHYVAPPVRLIKTYHVGIPLENYDLTKPVFLGVCKYDAPCPPKWADAMIQPFIKAPLTRKEYDSAHWVILTHSEVLSKDLLDWLAGLAI